MSEPKATPEPAEDPYGWIACLTIGGFLGVAVGWLVWPVLATGFAGAAALWAATQRGTRWIFLFYALCCAAVGSWCMAQSGGLEEALRMYVRLQWELVLIGGSYFTSGTQAPAGDILATHLLQYPVQGVSIAFGPILAILFVAGRTGIASSAEASPSLYPSGEGRRRNSGREGIPTVGRVTWMRGSDFAEMADDGAVEIWGYGIREGAVTGWIGVPKVGKSEAYTQLIGCMILGVADFLGFRVFPTSVVVMAEETPGVYRDKALTAAGWLSRSVYRGPRLLWPVVRRVRSVRRRGRYAWLRLIRRTPRDIYVICGKQLPGAKTVETLPHYINLASQKARETGSRVIVFDSLNFWVREAITNDAAAKDAARMFGELAACGYAVIIIHHMNKKGQMAGPDSLYSQLDFRVDCTVPGDVDPRTTPVRQLLWSGRFPRDYPAHLRQTVYSMDNAGYLRVVKAQPEVVEEDEEGETPADAPELPGSIGIVWAWFQAAAPEWYTADQIVSGVQAGGKLHAAGRIKSYVTELVDQGKVERDKDKGVRGNPIRYRRKL